MVTTAFLVLAITSTITRQNQVDDSGYDTSWYFEEDESVMEFQASLPPPEPDQRAERLAEMRQLIEANQDMLISQANVTPEEETIQESVTTNAESTSSSSNLEFNQSACGPVVAYQGAWQPQETLTKVGEGALVYYTEEEVEVTVASTSGSTTEMVVVTEVQERPQLQLPLRPMLASEPYCVASDVVGIATDGSLIRNNELAVYSIFGEDTLIGYALDGWPIYGSTNRQLDMCGGSRDEEGYGYYLSPEDSRTEIINCFVSQPTNL
jgi:hypothetical protein